MSPEMANPYNPLDKLNLAKSIEAELLARSTFPLDQTRNLRGAGVYVIYYHGPFHAYSRIAGNPNLPDARPIYVGKAIPEGGRKGGFTSSVSASGRALAQRLRDHANSVAQATNLELTDFSARHLVVDDIWIPLGENILIETFKPVWNVAVDGFGNKTPGRRRETQFKSAWDVLHPGRRFAQRLADPPVQMDLLLQRIEDHFAGRPLTRLPRELAQQEAEQHDDAVESADEV